MMKIPCELVVWYVLPTIRRDLAKELVEVHGMSQAKVARVFGVTNAAVSQYLKKKRGSNPVIENAPDYHIFEEEIKNASKRIAKEESDFSTEICNICTAVKKAGILSRIYREYLGCEPPLCSCDHDDIMLR